LKYSEFKDALQILGIPPVTSLEGVKSIYRKRVKNAVSQEELANLNNAYQRVTRFCTRYPFSFTKEEFYKAFPEEAIKDGFHRHPLWEER
jgi:hypothetical protein